MPAPSPSTKPSRSLSHGRLAVAGSSLRVESARGAAKPPTPSGLIVASEPPAIDHVGVAVLDQAAGLADAVVRRRARGDHREVRVP